MTPRSRIIPIFVPHLGCPNDCVFCNQRKISGSLTPATAATVTETVKAALDTLPQGERAEIAFYGGSFTAIPEGERTALLKAAQPFLHSGLVDGLRLSTRPDCVDERVLAQLRDYGVKTVELGAQSMDDEVLRRSSRGHTAADTERAAALVKRFGFALILQMMTGLPGDTPEKSVETARRIAALSPDGVRVYPTVIIRDTALYELWRRGEYREHTVEDAVSVCAKIADVFEAAGIPIIRLGLNPTDELSGGEAVGGAYHPALGELVYSRRYLLRAQALLSPPYPGTLTLGVHPSCVSLMVGQRRQNVEALKGRFGFKEVRVRGVGVRRGEIVILD